MYFGVILIFLSWEGTLSCQGSGAMPEEKAARTSGGMMIVAIRTAV
jgi:hypothetical protein